jgi:porin
VSKFAYAMMGATALYAGAASAEEKAEGPVQFSLSYTADAIGVVDGGLARRGRFLDNLDLMMDFDLERVGGWRGGSAHVHLLNNSGGIPNDDAGTLQGIDNIEVASQRLRLFEAWIEQSFGNASLRVGLYDLNSDFYANESAGTLIAPAFGVGSEIAATGSNGPSIFPSTALAARYHVQFDNDAFVRAAAINADAGVLGDPGGFFLRWRRAADRGGRRRGQAQVRRGRLALHRAASRHSRSRNARGAGRLHCLRTAAQ